MEPIAAFLATEAGKILAVVLLIIGISDIIIAKLIFGRQIARTEEQVSFAALPPDKREPLEGRIKGLQYASRTVITTGIVFILFGIYGITR